MAARYQENQLPIAGLERARRRLGTARAGGHRRPMSNLYPQASASTEAISRPRHRSVVVFDRTAEPLAAVDLTETDRLG